MKRGTSDIAVDAMVCAIIAILTVCFVVLCRAGGGYKQHVRWTGIKFDNVETSKAVGLFSPANSRNALDGLEWHYEHHYELMLHRHSRRMQNMDGWMNRFLSTFQGGSPIDFHIYRNERPRNSAMWVMCFLGQCDDFIKADVCKEDD